MGPQQKGFMGCNECDGPASYRCLQCRLLFCQQHFSDHFTSFEGRQEPQGSSEPKEGHRVPQPHLQRPEKQRRPDSSSDSRWR